MKKAFEIAQFVCACILFACAAVGFGFNARHFVNAPDGIVLIFIAVFVLYLCYLLVRESFKELRP